MNMKLLEVVTTPYIYNLTKHIEQTRIIFGRLRAASLKFNAPKCSFWLKEIPYLGYLIPREGIKLDPKKLQWIMDLGRPTTTTEAQALIGMVQYYRHMWLRQSHVLDTMTEASRGPKGRKNCEMTLQKLLFKN